MSHVGLHCDKCTSRYDSIFCELNHGELHGLDQHKVTNQYKRGQVIFHEGNPAAGLFCIFSGKVKLSKFGDHGKEHILKLAQRGDVLGYQSLLTDSGHNATAEVIEDTTVCFIDRSYFNQMLTQSSDLAFKVIQRLGQELCDSSNQMSDLLNKPVRQRFSNLLLTLAKAYGRKDARGTAIDVRLTRAEMASMVGATPETVIRLLSDFQELGYVELKGKEVIILNHPQLMNETGIQI